MASLVLRNTKGSALTNTEVDGNFQNLNNALGANGSVVIPTATGTGVNVLSTSPVLISPNIGTPSAGVLTNCTGLPVTSLVNLATGLSSWLTNPTSANLATVMLDESGSGNLVFNNNTSFTGTTTITTLALTNALSIANGGTGATSTSQALTNLLPTYTGSGTQVLTSTGQGSYYWSTGGGGSGGGSGGGTNVSTTRTYYTATAAQTLFSGTGTYTIGAGQLRVYINGIRQYPSDYTETSTTSFTLTNGATVGDLVMAEVDAYVTYTWTAAAISFAATGNIAATTVQNALVELDTEKLAIAGGTMTGGLVLPAGTTTLAPLKLTAGTNLTAATSGSVEWDGTSLYITNSTNTRKTVAYVDNIHYIGTTAIALNRASASQTLTGISIDGAAATATALNTANNYQVNSFGVGTAGSGTTGEIRATNNITAYYASDRKFKENIRDIDSPLNKVISIGSKYYDWSDSYIESRGGADGFFVTKDDYGVIAQDVLEVFPQAVRTRPDGSLAVDYTKLGILSFGAIAELLKRIEALESK